MYVVIELQAWNGTVANIVTTHETEESAMSKFHTIMAAAAVSSVPVHSAVVLTEEGYPVRNESYRHEVEVDG